MNEPVYLESCGHMSHTPWEACWCELIIKKEDEMGIKSDTDLRLLCIQQDTELRYLRAELESLRPRPVVKEFVLPTRLITTHLDDPYPIQFNDGGNNLKLVFENGTLIRAEVI